MTVMHVIERGKIVERLKKLVQELGEPHKVIAALFWNDYVMDLETAALIL